MRIYSKLGNGAWRAKRCNAFNVGSCGVKIPKSVATRINNILRRMPKEKTLGELADEGYKYWLAHYIDMGHSSQKYLVEALNAVAGETVVVAKRRYTKRVVEPAPTLPEPEPTVAVAKNTFNTVAVAENTFTPTISSETISKLSEKFRVKVKPTEEGEAMPPVVFSDGMYDHLNFAQLRNKCVAQARQLWKINAENADLRKRFYEMKERIEKIINVST
jgi:hypothetical protein